MALTARVSPTTWSTRTPGRIRRRGKRPADAARPAHAINGRVGGLDAQLQPAAFRPDAPVEQLRHRVGASCRCAQNRVIGTYALSWDIAPRYIVSQSIVGSYMAQCCGVQAEFSSSTSSEPDRLADSVRTDGSTSRFVLAGLGTFSNFFGAFGGN